MAKILIVEDNQHMHRIYTDKFKREGYEVFDAFTGEESLVIAAREKPEVMLLDLMMPGMDGFEVLQRMKTDPATASIPVLVISNKSQPVDVERALMLGARNFFHKGMTLLDDLAIETRRLCGIKKALLVSTRLPVAAAIVEQLVSLGYIASTNSIIAETVPRAEREQPDVIMLDGQFAAQNLQSLLHRLGISPKAKSIPIVFLGPLPPIITPPAHLRILGILDLPVDPTKLEEVLKRCALPETQPVAA